MPDDLRARPHPLGDLAAAVGLLTVLPVGSAWPASRLPRSTGWYPWIGWLLGVPAAIVLLGWLHVVHPSRLALLSGALVVALWAGVTRLLHWDGLADTCDGLLGGSTPERRLEIMRDSRTGAFGAAGMIMVALVQVAAISGMTDPGSIWPVIAAPVLGRFAVSMAAWQLPPARSDGLGMTAIMRPGPYEYCVAGAAVIALFALAWLGVALTHLLLVVAVGVLAGLVVPRVLSRGVGGMTGDLFGATVLVVEAAVLVTGALLA